MCRKRVVPIDAAGPGESAAGRRDHGRRGGDRQGRLRRRTPGAGLLRLDRAAEAKAKGEPLTADGVEIVLRKPDWRRLRHRARSRGGDVMSGTEPTRCPWTGIADAEYARYHDEEWGVPKTDDRALFEKLVLEGFQSGLSWLTILQEARQLPPRLRRLRCRAHRPLQGQGHCPPDGRCRHRAQQAEDRGDHRQCARAAEAAGAHAARGLPVGLRRRPPADQPAPLVQDACRPRRRPPRRSPRR